MSSTLEEQIANLTKLVEGLAKQVQEQDVKIANNDKAKSKAMKIAVVVPGVKSVSFGDESDRLEVIGEGVDFVSLVNSLGKKISFADIISLEDVKPAGSESSPSSPPAGSSPTPSFAQKLQPPPPHYYPPPLYWTPVYYESRVYEGPPPSCSIL